MLKTALTLTEDQLQRMARYVRSRIEGMDAARRHGWLAERERFEREWNDDFTHRQWESAVFSKSNESLNLVGSGVDYIRARMLDEIFGSKPWFAVDPRSDFGRDADLAAKVTRHLRWKLGRDQVDFEGVATDLVAQACKLGECVAKVFYKTDEERYERIASILWDEETDSAALTAEGDFVFEGASGENAPLPPGRCWKERIVSENVVHYSGAKALPLHYKEFYCPLNAPSIHEADFVAHMTSMRLSTLCAHLGVTLEEAGAEASGAPGDAVAQALRQIQRLNPDARSVSGEPLEGEGEERGAGAADPEFRLVEAYFKFDARGDGKPVRAFMLMAYDLDLPIFWDYIANATPDGRYPFEAVVVNKEAHRWYGKSWFKKYEKFQCLIDKLLNQILYRNELAANPVKFRRKEAVVQWQDDQPFEIGPDKVFDLNDGYSAEDALQTAQIPELDEQTKFLLEMVVANWRTRSGVSTASQGDASSLPNRHTATAAAHLAANGKLIFKPLAMDAKRGLDAVLRQVVEYQYAFQDADETFDYREGEARVYGTLSRESVRDLAFDVELTLKRATQGRNLDAAKMAVDFFGKFLAVPDGFKAVAAPLFATVYKSLEIDHADEYFQKIVALSGAAAAAAGPDGAAISEDATAGVMPEPEAALDSEAVSRNGLENSDFVSVQSFTPADYLP